MKKLLRILIVLVVLVVVAAVVAVFAIDSLAKSGLETAASYALDVDTTVDDLSISLIGGRLEMDGLRIANPPGFSSEHLMKSGRFALQLKTATLFSDTVELTKFDLDGLDVNIEQKLTENNVARILDNLKRFDSKKQTDADESKEGKRIKVDKIVIKNVVVHFHLLPGSLTGGDGTMDVKISEIVLEDVGGDESGGVVVAELVRKIVPAILEAVLKEAEGVVPGDFVRDLQGRVSGLEEAIKKADVGDILEGLLPGLRKTPAGDDE